MRFPWVIVGGTGYDVEEVDNARTHDMECPSCEKNVRFVEKMLIKNLRVFGVPLVGVEKGRRVFECPHCHVCVEPPEEEPAKTEAPSVPDPQIEAIEARLQKLDDEIWLWKSRAQMAADKGARDLEFEAIEWKTKAERESVALRDKLASLRSAASARRTEPAQSGTKTPAIVARKGGEIVDRAADDEFAALKAKLARKQSDEHPNEPGDEHTRGETKIDSEKPPVEAPGETATPSEASTTRAPESTENASTTTPEPDVEADFAALRARLAKKSDATAPSASESDKDYESLKREMSEPASASEVKPETAPAVPNAETPSGGDSDDDDPVAALKRKLRKK